MEIDLVWEYLIFTFTTSLAVIGLVASIKSKDNLKIFKSRNFTIGVSLVLIILSFFWFFTIRDRSVQTYMEGAQISATFGLGAFLSIVVTKTLRGFYGHS